ncbi:hypothetical protein [Tolypothrix sp. VBCCA 56010]|uniref:hypothetical protein n=1 Tax=Tolypothrix sp. VBCCA 56010 TaxID=3137731 RepID=UPI003D7D2CD8
MQRSRFRFRREKHVIGTRIKMYEQREKWLYLINNQIEVGEDASLNAAILANGIRPRAVTLEIIYEKIDYAQPPTDDNDDELFDVPSVVLREIVVDTGVILSEFKLHIHEAKNLVKLLANI